MHAIDLERRGTTETRARAIDELDAIDYARLLAPQIDRLRALSGTQNAAELHVIRPATAPTVEDLHVHDLDVVVDCTECNTAKATFAAPDAQDISVSGEPDLLAAEQLDTRPAVWWAGRPATANPRINAQARLSFEVQSRPVDELDLPQEAAVTAQVDIDALSLAKKLINPEVFGKSIHVDDPDIDHVNVIAFRREAKIAEWPLFAEPSLVTIEAQHVSINQKADTLLTEAYPAVASRFPLRL